MFRPIAVVPLVFSLTAFILGMLCIFAGSKPGYLESANLLTLDTSMFGQESLKTSKTSSTTLKSIENTVQKDVNTAVSDVAKDLNIHDFYSAHLLDYCEGYYTPGPVSNLTSDPAKNVTSCSNQTAFFSFDPTTAIQNELKPGVSLSDLKWPSAIQDALKAIEVASKVMFLLYCIGVSCVGLALVGALIGLFASGRLFTVVNFMTSILAFFSLMLASAISTGVINKVVSAVNAHGNEVGIFAYKGMTFVGMTWAADILILLASFVYVFEFIKGRREQTSYMGE